MRKPQGWWVCVKKGWYARWDENLMCWFPCLKDSEGARPDLNRYRYWKETGREDWPE